MPRMIWVLPITGSTVFTDDAHPWKQAPGREPLLVREKLREEIKRLSQLGIIVPSQSPWGPPIVAVVKPNGSLRLCVDYRFLNSLMKNDSFPLPSNEDLLARMRVAKYFTTLDMLTGYHQIAMAPQDQVKTDYRGRSSL